LSGHETAALRFFLDANVLISAAWKPHAEVAGIWQLEGVQLLTSMLVMSEVQRNLARIHQIERLRGFMAQVTLFPAMEWSDSLESVPELLELPEKDRHVLAAAVLSHSDYLITGDKKHFSQWFGRTIHGVKIEPPTNLLKSFRLRDP
jgi:predicted nucleic acid-binding protein